MCVSTKLRESGVVLANGLLPMAKRVERSWCRSGQAYERTDERERPAREAGDRPHPGPLHPEKGCVAKHLSPTKVAEPSRVFMACLVAQSVGLVGFASSLALANGSEPLLVLRLRFRSHVRRSFDPHADHRGRIRSGVPDDRRCRAVSLGTSIGSPGRTRSGAVARLPY